MRTSILGVIAALGAFALFGVASPAEADVNITGSGLWGDNTPDTPFSAPGGSWVFSFNLENNPISSNPTNDITNFSYELNGVEVSNTLFSPFVTAEFFPADLAGMFVDLSFSNGDVVSFYGADIGSPR